MALIFHGKEKQAEVLLKRAYPILQKEHDYFMNNRKVEVELDGVKYILNHYKANLSTPRPESFK
jgi:alpha,alpha-trehalase